MNDKARRWWIEGGLIVGFWGITILLNIAQRSLDPRHGAPPGLLPGEGLQVVVEYALWALVTPATFWLTRRYRLEGKNWLRHVFLYLIIAIVVGVALDQYGHATFNALVAVDWERNISVFRSLTNLFFLDELIIYLVVLFAGFARDYFLRYRERLNETAQLKTQAVQLQASLAEARLQALRMQINPHFLFNTLHAVSSLVERDPRGVRRMIARLSELLRYTLEHTSSQEVTLQEELQFLHGYLEIQRIRFQGKLEVHEDIDPDVLEALVPNLILQPLVENAIKHGASQVEGAGRIELRAWRERQQIYLSVRDNGPGLVGPGGDGVGSNDQGVGLNNTRARLEGLYGTAQQFTLKHAKGGGVVAQIALPYHTAADLRTTSVQAT